MKLTCVGQKCMFACVFICERERQRIREREREKKFWDLHRVCELYSFIWQYWGWTQSFMLARPVLYFLSHASYPFCQGQPGSQSYFMLSALAGMAGMPVCPAIVEMLSCELIP
jgi:hypothetical protein